MSDTLLHRLRQLTQLEGALREARDKFRWYAELHAEKDPPALDKAKANKDMADLCDKALNDTTDRVTPLVSFVEDVARQKLSTEFEDEGGDYEDGYNIIVTQARKAKAQWEGVSE